MFKNILPVIKFSFIVILFAIFFFLFGIRFIQKYLDDGNLTKISSEILEEPVKAPSIMVCSPAMINGSLPSNDEDLYTFFEECKDARREEINNCILAHTQSLDDTILKINDFEPFGHFTSEMTPLGQCHTLDSRTTFGPLPLPMVKLTLNASVNRIVYIGDKNFRYFSDDPDAVPGSRKFAIKDTQSGYSLKIIKKIKRNTQKNPCIEDVNHSFTNCLEESVEKKVGCSLPLKKSNFKACSNYESFKEYENHWTNIAFMPKSEVAQRYGCIFPCQSLQYEIVESVSMQNYKKGPTLVEFGLSTREIAVETEEQIYEWTSLVGDLGGSLGLFLGFSFFMFWDWILFLIHFLKAKV